MLQTFYVGVKGVIVKDSKALILKSSRTDRKTFWDIPGGRINDRETILQTLRRELREELPSIGKFKIGKLLNVYRLSMDLPDGYGLVLIYYKVEAEDFQIYLSDEHCEYAWIAENEIDSLKAEEGYKKALKLALKDT
ncbi:NUDIX domain-containing protein [Candidatus Dojkabacteria bacterium]|nr:NUDIX domain-containing protein [Candidatus Dojkabacteria bacterium]